MGATLCRQRCASICEDGRAGAELAPYVTPDPPECGRADDYKYDLADGWMDHCQCGSKIDKVCRSHRSLNLVNNSVKIPVACESQGRLHLLLQRIVNLNSQNEGFCRVCSVCAGLC